MRGKALTTRFKIDSTYIASVGYVRDKDKGVVPVVADELLNTVGINTVYCLGYDKEETIASIRTDKTTDLNELPQYFNAAGGGKEGAGKLIMRTADLVGNEIMARWKDSTISNDYVDSIIVKTFTDSLILTLSIMIQ